MLDSLTDTQEDKFWSKVKIGNSDECWEWQRGRDKNGYGKFTAMRIQMKSHRVAWALARGKIPDGLLVLHKCDNPPCVNVNHLYLGTWQDNMDDKVSRGRAYSPQGEKQWASKLTTEDVLKIRQLQSEGKFTQRQLGNIFQVTESQISHIVHRKEWTHI